MIMTRYVGQFETTDRSVRRFIARASINPGYRNRFEIYVREKGFTSFDPIGKQPDISSWWRNDPPTFISYLEDGDQSRLDVEALTKPEAVDVLHAILNGYVVENGNATGKELRDEANKENLQLRAIAARQ